MNRKTLLGLFLSIVPAIAACSSTSGSGDGVVNGGIGAICTSAATCASGQTCRTDTTEWIAHHQCTVSCSTDADCTGAYGGHTQCIGANICVSKCLDDSNCPSGTICNEFGWCGNTGPGSGVPICAGTPEPCSSVLSQTDCVTALGCSWNGNCTGAGASTSCYSQFDEFSCSSQSGCIWNAQCSGAQTETSCKKISPSLCKYTPGCALAPQ